MNCHIALQCQNAAPRSVWICEGQTVQVGRNDWADFTVPEDAMMSRLHFAIDSDSEKFLLRDLGSRNGTYVNGEQVSSCELSNGDEIRAGGSAFRVSLTQLQSRFHKPETGVGEPIAMASRPPNPPGEESKDSVESLIQAIRETGKLGAETVLLDELERRTATNNSDEQTLAFDGLTHADVQFSYDEMSAPGGVIHYCSTHRRARPIELARMLVSRPGYYVVVNLQNMEPAARSFFSASSPGRQFTRINQDLIMVGQDDSVDQLEVFSRGWGRDAITGVVSRLAKEYLLERVRSAAENFMFPGVFLRDLRRSSPNKVLQLLADVDAVFLEDRHQEQWSLVINPLSKSSWQTLGLSTAPQRVVKSGTDTA